LIVSNGTSKTLKSKHKSEWKEHVPAYNLTGSTNCKENAWYAEYPSKQEDEPEIMDVD